MSDIPVVIVGAGLAGLTCARRLQKANISFQMLEQSDCYGGRVRTDEYGGFLLDRGFQVLLTAYPETKHWLDYEPLDLKPFYPGSLIWTGKRFHRLADPWRNLKDAVLSAFAPVGSLTDKLRIARLRSRALRGSLDRLFSRPERTTQSYLKADGFSDQIIQRFFRPFFGGVFLDGELQTSSRMLEFVFRMFALGEIALPAFGMQQIPHQLAESLPEESCRLNEVVTEISQSNDQRIVRLSSGETLSTNNLVLATEEPVTRKLLGTSTSRDWQSVTTLYFSADQPPLEEPILVLNGTDAGPINNLCCPSQVSPHYAPSGASLISVSVLGNPSETDSELEAAVRSQLREWFGVQIQRWQLLKVYRIAHALPSQVPPALEQVHRPTKQADGLYVCGDHLDTASINGAMFSGRAAAEALLAHLPS